MTLPNKNGKLYNKKTLNHKQNPHNGISKEQTGYPTKNCLTTLILEWNTNQEEPIIHFINTLITITNKTISKTTIYHGSLRAKALENVKQPSRNSRQTPHQKTETNTKQQRAKTWHTIKCSERRNWPPGSNRVRLCLACRAVEKMCSLLKAEVIVG